MRYIKKFYEDSTLITMDLFDKFKDIVEDVIYLETENDRYIKNLSIKIGTIHLGKDHKRKISIKECSVLNLDNWCFYFEYQNNLRGKNNENDIIDIILSRISKLFSNLYGIEMYYIKGENNSYGGHKQVIFTKKIWIDRLDCIERFEDNLYNIKPIGEYKNKIELLSSYFAKLFDNDNTFVIITNGYYKNGSKGIKLTLDRSENLDKIKISDNNILKYDLIWNAVTFYKKNDKYGNNKDEWVESDNDEKIDYLNNNFKEFILSLNDSYKDNIIKLQDFLNHKIFKYV